ncbi:MAG: hypothetical protein JRI34_03915 [Deltaproteobacteria bacterium]|nr:hypothetical protein [Deltaproteobacteria bacterium]
MPDGFFDEAFPIKRIGKYEILDLLARGGMSRVYKVCMPLTGKILA